MRILEVDISYNERRPAGNRNLRKFYRIAENERAAQEPAASVFMSGIRSFSWAPLWALLYLAAVYKFYYRACPIPKMTLVMISLNFNSPSYTISIGNTTALSGRRRGGFFDYACFRAPPPTLLALISRILPNAMYQTRYSNDLNFNRNK